MLSDHVPIGFKIKIEEPSSDIHEFRAMSMNMLASAYMPFSFWNTPPSEGTELWLLASRARAAMDRKTKWLPGEYKSMSRSNLTAKQLDEADSCPLIEWERANRRFWNWISKVQTMQFDAAQSQHLLASNEARLGMLACLLMQHDASYRPDVIFLQEVGLEALRPPQLARDDGATGLSEVELTQLVLEACPTLNPLLCEEGYRVVNLSPKLNVRRGNIPETKDNGLILVKHSVLRSYRFQPVTMAVDETNKEFIELSQNNAGKPIVGVQVQCCNGNDQEMRPLANLYGAHFDKGKTQQNLEHLVQVMGGMEETKRVPTLVTGDFNAVLLPP